MPFRERVKRAMSRRHNLKISSSPSTTNIQSEETSRNLTPFYGSGTGTPILRKNLTIDPRENPLTRIESSVTLKKRSTLSRMKSSLKKEDPYKDWPEDIYKPHEMPKAKYRRPTDPDHQQSLQSYCLRSAFEDVRRRSGVSQYSPMGSRWHSRRGSVSSRFAKSAGPSRNHSIAQALTETDDDDHDVESNTGLCRYPSIPVYTRSSRDTVPDLMQSSSIDSDDTDSFMNSSKELTLGNSSRDGGVQVPNFSKPFDEDELTRALTRTLISGRI